MDPLKVYAVDVRKLTALNQVFESTQTSVSSFHTWYDNQTSIYLPQEILDLIDTFTLQGQYGENCDGCIRAWNCALRICRPEIHFTPE